MLLARRDHQWCQVLSASSVNVSSEIEENTHYVKIASSSCHIQRRFASIVLTADVCPEFLNQVAGNFMVAQMSCRY
jgi:hypothetical protein